ncbi:ribose ABC transporter substrate-binding protein RbsB [Sporohalobacter salinus]|uniref:ribose ABC transporter substrate-binding protein RbsB n=1 Tax=Sporohalobacter salinus TaxID=1494606 RepID=UPI00195F722D|nr:ribose ABC transporter substrate-binding protein RbsB [Sporohalobacter salinus]MBM7622550.1 ribose transport system substrate-binding protein [Sporohalobacter salinus]
MRNKLIAIALILVVAVGVLGCQNNTKQSKEKEGLKIGLAVSTQNNPFFVDLKNGAEKKAKKLGIELLTVDAQDDAAKQQNSIEDLIMKEVDVLIINPVDGDAVVSAIESANEADIPVITVDRGANGGEVVSHIASDNVEGGKMAADFIAKKLNEKGKVVELEGIPGTSAARDRGKGFNKGIKEYGDIEVIANQPADFNRAKGMTVMENILQSESNIDAVFAHNDSMALGAIEAIKAADRSDEITVVGFDAIDDAVKSVKEGKLAATIAQKPGLMGEMAVETAKKVANDKKVKDYTPVPLKLITE